MNAHPRRFSTSRFLWASAILSSSIVAAGCDKAKEETTPAPASVIMPGTAAPTDAAASALPPVSAGATNNGDATSSGSTPAIDSVAASGISAGNNTGNNTGNSTGNSGRATGGTLSVIPGANPPADSSTTPNPGNSATTSAPPVAIDPGVLPSSRSASTAAAGAIGPSASGPSSDDQPPSKAPGSKT